MVDTKVVPFDEFYYQLKLMHLFQKHPVYSVIYHFPGYIPIPGNEHEHIFSKNRHKLAIPEKRPVLKFSKLITYTEKLVLMTLLIADTP
jgi:hypothetical protein